MSAEVSDWIYITFGPRISGPEPIQTVWMHVDRSSTRVNEWVSIEFNAPPDTIQAVSEADKSLGVLYISYSVMDDQRHK